MHIWTIDNCKCFAKWLRSEYYFPIRVPVYIKDKTYIKARDGEHVVGTFLGPYDYSCGICYDP